MFDINHIGLQEATVYITGLAAITALLVPYIQDGLSRKPNKSKLRIEDVRIYDQSPDNEYLQLCGQPQYWESFGRIRIYNGGEHTAKNVGANVEKVIHNGKEDKDFLPLPLIWTHTVNGISRDILPKQSVYLDVIHLFASDDTDSYMSDIATPVRRNDDTGGYYIGVGETLLDLVIYQESGQVVRKRVKVVKKDEKTHAASYTITLL